MLMFLVLILFMLFPDKTVACAKEVLGVWYTAVVPSLLPFFIACKLLTVTKEADKLRKRLSPLFRFLCLPEALAYPFFMSLLCGTPTGARILGTWSLPDNAKTDYTAVCCCPGPLFVIGTVGVSMLHSAEKGYELCLISVCASLLTLFFTPLAAVNVQDECADGSAAEAVWDSLKAILLIAGTMLLFSLPTKILFSLLPDVPPALSGFLTGLGEFTGGINILSGMTGSLPLIAFLLSFGGGSVIFQCLSFVPGTKALPFVLRRLEAGMFAFLLCFLAEKTVWAVPVSITVILIAAKTVHRRKKMKRIQAAASTVTY